MYTTYEQNSSYNINTLNNNINISLNQISNIIGSYPYTINDLNLSLYDLVKCLSNNFTSILSREEIALYKQLNWGQNGIGDRWCKKMFNYTTIYQNGVTKTYSENDLDTIDNELLNNFLHQRLEPPRESLGDTIQIRLNSNQQFSSGIIGIFVHSKRNHIDNRGIRPDILKYIRSLNCVVCGSNNEIRCDHKNDFYNDDRVLNSKLQLLSDFQPLCNHCNLLKRQVCRDEIKNKKIYSAKNISSYKVYDFQFPWEKYALDENNINLKSDSYWYDPVKFNYNVHKYMKYLLPVLKEIKHYDKIKFLEKLMKLFIMLVDVEKSEQSDEK